MLPNIQSNVKFKIFVKQTNGEESSAKPKVSANYFTVSPLTGDKAREFYEDVLKEPSVVHVKEKAVVKPKLKAKPPPKTIQTKVFKNTDLLWMAQNNDVKNMNVFFDQKDNHDINVVDDFGWTPLMCASYGGAKEAVEILLWKGADTHKQDKLGNTALELAKKNHQNMIVEILESYNKEPEVFHEEETLETTVEPFSCQTCKMKFSNSKHKHESSTLHLFNSKFKTSTFYGIPENNKGFQLLLREGWDREKGLGPAGKGRKFPVKAVMKKDRAGIGAPPPSHDKNKQGTMQTEKHENKKRYYEKWKEKEFEKNFRLEFS